MKSLFSITMIAALVGFSLSPVWPESREPILLPQLLDQVKKVNPDVNAARKSWEAAQARIPAARGLPAPQVGIEFEEIPKGTVKLNQATILYQLIQSLPFPGKLSLRQQVAVKEAQVAAMDFKKTEWDVVSQLKSVYYDLFMLDREGEIQERQIEWLSQAAAAASGSYSTGTSAYSELLMAQAKLLEGQNSLRVLNHRRKTMEVHLNHLLNQSVHTPVGSPTWISLQAVPEDPEKLTERALAHQPELLAFQYSTERAEAAWRLSKRELLPDLETMVELRDPAMGPIGPWDLTLALVLPFWFWTKERYGVKVALKDKESAESAYQAMKNEISRRVHESWHRAQAAYQTAQVYEEGLIPLAKQAVTAALAGYQAGQGSYSDLLGALEFLNEEERTYYEQLILLEQEIVKLEQSVGVPLRPIHEMRVDHEE